MLAAQVFVVVLAGGSGTRFWPASRASRPKQLLPLAGSEPMIRETIDRVLPLVGSWERVLVAGGRATEAETRALLPELPSSNLLVEPSARNTAPCIAWAAARVARVDPDAVCVVLPSDHHIADQEAFRGSLRTAIEAASRGAIVTIGVRPTSPETGFGYLEVAPGEGPVRQVARFVEKPTREKAESFLASGNYLWNAGMFVFRARDMLGEIATHLPEVAAAVERFDAAARDGREGDEVAVGFPRLPSISIDYGVMERARSIAVVPGDFGWSDVGSWQAAWELAAKDSDGNTHSEGVIYVDAKGNHVARASGGKRVIALLGVEDLVVVETDDALLVAPRARAQDVRLVVDALKARRPDAL